MTRFLMLLRTVTAALVMAILLATPGAAQEFTRPSAPPPPDTWQVSQLPTGWVTVRGPAFEISGSADHVAVLDRLSAHGTEALPRLADELGVGIGDTIRVYLADSHSSFIQLQPGAPPYWSDGTAWPGHGVIFLRHPSLRQAGAKPLEQVLDHELVHVLLGRAFAPAPTPHWLQEGVAQVYAGETGPDLPARISRGLLGRTPYTLQSLAKGFPADAGGAGLAYAQTADFIQWFREQYGADAVRTLIRETSAGRPLEAVVAGIADMSLAQVDKVWRTRLVASTPVWTRPENMEAVLWAGGGLLLLVGGWSRRRAFRRRLATWRSQDAGLDRIARDLLERRRS